ncbi:MAG: VTT domain-containing protein [Candidatus Anstonellales archaeon]
MMPPSLSKKVTGTLTIIASILIIIAVYYLSFSLKNPEKFGYFGAFLIGLISSGTVILPAPGVWSLLVLGNFANPFIIGFLFGIGSALGEISGYLAGLGSTKLLDGNKKEIENNMTSVKKWGALAIFVFALVPNPLFDFAGIAAGLIRMNFFVFFFSCAAGKIIKGIIISYLGMALL